MTKKKKDDTSDVKGTGESGISLSDVKEAENAAESASKNALIAFPPDAPVAEEKKASKKKSKKKEDKPADAPKIPDAKSPAELQSTPPAEEPPVTPPAETPAPVEPVQTTEEEPVIKEEEEAIIQAVETASEDAIEDVAETVVETVEHIVSDNTNPVSETIPVDQQTIESAPEVSAEEMSHQIHPEENIEEKRLEQWLNGRNSINHFELASSGAVNLNSFGMLEGSVGKFKFKRAYLGDNWQITIEN